MTQPSISDAAARLHRDAIVVEGHGHVLTRPSSRESTRGSRSQSGTIDYARAVAGGVNVLVEHLFVEDRYNDYNYAVKQACRLIETFHRVLEASPARMALPGPAIVKVLGENWLRILDTARMP